jgi:hypothetical protein
VPPKKKKKKRKKVLGLPDGWSNKVTKEVLPEQQDFLCNSISASLNTLPTVGL